MLVKTSLTLFLVAACASTLAHADKAVSCKHLVQDAVRDDARKETQTGLRERELCFPGEQDCLVHGRLAAEDIWKSAINPDEVESVLTAYADYTGRVSQVDMPSKGGKIVRIEVRWQGHCVRDTYFLYRNGRN